MNDKEILAELKISYNYLLDIIENADKEQMDNFGKHKLEDTLETLAIEYETLYKKTKVNLMCKDDLKIGNYINVDYLDNENNIILYVDILGEYKWWEDYQFLTDL